MIIGQCSLCHGLAEYPDVWYGVIPPVPTCRSCGATKKYPIVEMSPLRNIEAIKEDEQDFIDKVSQRIDEAQKRLNNEAIKLALNDGSNK